MAQTWREKEAYRSEASKERRRKYVRQRQRDFRAKVQALKQSPCVDCGVQYPPYVMDWDHRDPSEKSFNVSQTLTRCWDSILAEIEKCDLVCANCHRERTYGGAPDGGDLREEAIIAGV